MAFIKKANHDMKLVVCGFVRFNKFKQFKSFGVDLYLTFSVLISSLQVAAARWSSGTSREEPRWFQQKQTAIKKYIYIYRLHGKSELMSDRRDTIISQNSPTQEIITQGRGLIQAKHELPHPKQPGPPPGARHGSGAQGERLVAGP